MPVLLWVVLPYCAVVSFVLGNVWRYRHDRFHPAGGGPDIDRLERYGANAFRLGTVLVLAARVTDVATSGPHDHPRGVLHAIPAGVEMVAGPTAAAGAVLVFLPPMIAGAYRAPVTPLDRLTLPVLTAVVLSGILVRFDPNSLDGNYRPAETLFAWARSLFILRPKPETMADAPALHRLRALTVLLLIGIWPYTRLAGIFAGPVVRYATRCRTARLIPRPGRPGIGF
ncbi:respiratory nitrate reductase subunit gamma [Nocardia wallacei]|uniref:Nitrate reductase subunit gamma n=1 Tax=Nocardia wallacei TaxID=480035 RepID=A0A7G1KDU3_9NOCA|nr:respiratory nitrate reductase subunit gamma [Nocardia wallacei]BCK53407.1 nitrate reductase subunit gamma [Nocardia wallacei]